MKKFIHCVVMIFLLAACGSPDNKQKDDDMTLVKNYVAAVEKLDYEAMGNYLADNYMGLGPSYGDTIYKKEAIESWKYNSVNLYSKIEHTMARYAFVTITEGPAKGNWIACWSELKITYKNGKSVMIWANSDYMVENGKITRTLSLYNEADALRQLGYQIVAPQ